MNIEALVADAVLQNPVEVEIDGEKHLISKPTLGTLIEASKYISEIPELAKVDIEKATPDQIIAFCMVNAEKCEKFAYVLAVLILGRNADKTQRERKRMGFLGIFKRKKKRDVYKEVADRILSTMSSEEIVNLFAKLIGLQNLGFFLQLTTSLNEINLLKRTKTS